MKQQVSQTGRFRRLKILALFIECLVFPGFLVFTILWPILGLVLALIATIISTVLITKWVIKKRTDRIGQTALNWLASYIIAGLIWAVSVSFRKTTADQLIVAVIAIGAGFFYHRLKTKIRIKNGVFRIIVTFLILEGISGFLIGVLTTISKQDSQIKHYQSIFQTPLPSPDTNFILLNYKIDSANTMKIMDVLISAVYNDPNSICPNIIAAKISRKNAYYLYLDAYNSLESKYGKYSSTITYIDNNLRAFNQLLQEVKDKCAAADYVIE